MTAIRTALVIALFAPVAAAERSPAKVCCQTVFPSDRLVVTCSQAGAGKAPTDIAAYCRNPAGYPTAAYLVEDCAAKCPIGVYPERYHR